MEDHFLSISLIVTAGALLAWLACFSHQPIVLAYFVCGVIIGPHALKVVQDVELLEHISRIGVTLLLFLAGMVLHPDRLKTFFRQATVVTLGGSAVSWLICFAFLRLWGYSSTESFVGALALMFSSTILVIKLLPTTTLHQRRMGSICIAILIAQDLIAVLVLLFLGAEAGEGRVWLAVWIVAKLLLLIAVAVLGEQYVLRPMMWRADRYGEVLVMLCLAWCLSLAVASEYAGLSYEVGAFMAGVAMARGKIALVLSERLKPLRDFFLMFFFFVLGAKFDVWHIGAVWLPAIILGALIIVLRPIYVKFLFRFVGEEKAFAQETALRLGQASEFALIIAVAAGQNDYLGKDVSYLVQLVTIITMVASSYLVVTKCPTPIGVEKSLLRD